MLSPIQCKFSGFRCKFKVSFEFSFDLANADQVAEAMQAVAPAGSAVARVALEALAVEEHSNYIVS